MKIIKLILKIKIYLLILISIWFFVINYINVNVVFYSAIYVSIFSLLPYLLITNSITFFKESKFEILQQMIICLLIGILTAILIPTVIDRSLSFYILEKIHQRGGGIKFDKFNYVFSKEYINEHRLVDVRITEQIESGTILLDNDCVKITKKGEQIILLSKFVRTYLLPKKRLLMGEYTDDLINPFKNSENSADYLCN
jgi:hypothetical protein